MTKESAEQSRGSEAKASPGAYGAPLTRRKAGATLSMSWRPVWWPVLLGFVGVLAFLYYPHSDSGTFYATAAAVIATLYVAIAVSIFDTKDSSRSEMTFEHWVFMLAGSVGLLAALRGLSVGTVHDAWHTRLLTGLTVVGIIATVWLVAERLVASRISRTPAAAVWTVLFIATAIILVVFP